MHTEILQYVTRYTVYTDWVCIFFFHAVLFHPIYCISSHVWQICDIVHVYLVSPGLKLFLHWHAHAWFQRKIMQKTVKFPQATKKAPHLKGWYQLKTVNILGTSTSAYNIAAAKLYLVNSNTCITKFRMDCQTESGLWIMWEYF